MKFTGELLQKINAQVDSASHPTIPYIPPGNPTPEPTSATTVPTQTPTNDPYIYLSSEDNSYEIGDSGVITINIDTFDQEIDEFEIIIEFDPSHIEILDSDAAVSGIQILFLDTNFDVVENIVETDIVGTESGLPGRITLRATTDTPTTISDRAMAEIEFNILAGKTSELTIASNSSTLISDSVNVLNTNLLEPFVINSSGAELTPTPVIGTPTPSITPITAISSPEGLLFAIGGTLLIISGLFLRRKVKNSDSIDNL